MKRTLVLLAVVGVAAVLVAWAQGPLRHVDSPSSTGGSNAMPVSVANFPLDTDGYLLAATPVANRVLDLLDTEALVPWQVGWLSETFDAGPFNLIAVQATGSVFGGASNASTECRVQWQLTPDDPFHTAYPSNDASPALVEVSTLLEATAATRRSGLSAVQAPLARVKCVVSGGSADHTVTDVKILLRRE